MKRAFIGAFSRWVLILLIVCIFLSMKELDVPVKQEHSDVLLSLGGDNFHKGLTDLNADGTYRGILEKWQPAEVAYLTRLQREHQQYRLVIGIMLLAILLSTVWLLLLFRQISKSRQIEAALRESEHNLREAQHISSMGSWKWNLITGEIAWSDEMYEIFDIDKKSMSGRLGGAISKVIHPEDANIFNRENTRALSEREPFEYRIIRKDGAVCHILAKTGEAVFDKNGNPVYMVGTAQDITEQKAIRLALMKARDEAEAANIAQSHFFATMSHEFRTPLNVMLSIIQLFESYMKSDGNLTAERTERHLKSMKQNSLRLLRLVNNLIDISRIDAGSVEPVFHDYDIVDLIRKIVQSLSDYIRQKRICVRFTSEPEEKIIQCDADMMERIMLNLISNAIKFSGEDCVIDISIVETEQSVVIKVKDNGVGIEADKQQLIFERYKQISTTLARQSEGSGIGLSLTKSLVELHGGTISVQSEFGKGSEFILSFPAVRCTQTDSAAGKNTKSGTSDQIVIKMSVEFSDIYR